LSALENISTTIANFATSQEDSIAISDQNITLSYSELNKRVDQGHTELKNIGLEAGDIVLAVGENSIGFCIFLLSAARMGITLVLENSRRASPELAHIIKHSQPAGQFFFHDHSPDSVSHSNYFNASLKNSGVFGEYGFLKKTGSSQKIDEKNIFAIIYTTGTTGEPKGVMLTHANLNYIAKMIRQLKEIQTSDKVLAVLPISHVMGLASVLLGTLHSGASIYFLPRFTPKSCYELIQKYQISVLQGAPVMFSKLVDYIAKNQLQKPKSLKFLGSGGAPIDQTLKEKVLSLLNCQLHNGYGLTEIPSVCWTRLGETIKDDSVGKALPGVSIEFKNKEGKSCLINEVGELWTKGPNLMTGYFKNSELTKKVIDSNGWFNTQDLGYINEADNIYIVGRTKDLIIRSGFKVYPQEVESALLTHPSILHAAVIGHKINGNEEVIAFIEVDKTNSFSGEELLTYLRERLSPYKIPKKIIQLPSLPLAANGKILKSKLISEIQNNLELLNV
jgi:acyl-CoA synthetase (AMP-forming)/AMP-acid ligase II